MLPPKCRKNTKGPMLKPTIRHLPAAMMVFHCQVDIKNIANNIKQYQEEEDKEASPKASSQVFCLINANTLSGNTVAIAAAMLSKEALAEDMEEQ